MDGQELAALFYATEKLHYFSESINQSNNRNAALRVQFEGPAYLWHILLPPTRGRVLVFPNSLTFLSVICFRNKLPAVKDPSVGALK